MSMSTPFIESFISASNEHIPEREPAIQSTSNALNPRPHPEGSYFHDTNRDPRRVANPHQQPIAPFTDLDINTDTKTRSASPSILYHITPQRPLGALHRNRRRTVHVWQRGRGDTSLTTRTR
ncbi:Protein of unknown function DUF985 [Penicillium camemberti]|uniref:DUF985 domain-containing protein n=1 Tax=Penicillium camemberti (strain FM 013) TaxID=1429867 RepID=A0A0G4PI59_PENC3|nr:Protein of unknown function DUF985 [Penicillium camemberti]